MVTGGNLTLNLTEVTCNGNHCTLVYNDSRLSTNEEYNASVVASNIFGSSSPVYYVGKTYVV